MNAPKKSLLLFVLIAIAFASFALLACDEGPSCGNLPGDTPCLDASQIIMGDKSPVEAKVGELLAGDCPQNVLSGGNPNCQ